MCKRENKKRDWDKLKSSSGSNDGSHAPSGIIPKKARKEIKKKSQGEARFLPLCKRSRIMYSKYSSQYYCSWNDADYKNKKISGSVSDRDSATKIFKKQEKYWIKELKMSQRKTSTFYKLAPQALKKSDIKRIMKNMEDSSDSDSDSENRPKQEIHRYKPQ